MALKTKKTKKIELPAKCGVKDLADIRALLPYERDGIEGVIVGKSIYTGSLDLKKAIALAAKGE